MKDKINIFLLRIDYFFCLILAFAFTSAPFYMNTGECAITLTFVLSSVSLYAIFLYITNYIRRYLTMENIGFEEFSVDESHLIKKIFDSPKSILLITTLILVSWCIPLIFLYPGTFINDTWGELQQYISFTQQGGVLQDHHPIFDTVILGVLIVPLAEASGKWHIVIFLYVLLQAALTGLSFAYAINYFYKKLHIGFRFSRVLFVAYCLLPLYPASVQTVSKDALFSWIYVFFLVDFIEVIRSNGRCLSNKVIMIKLIVFAILCCLTKKVGFYVVFFSLMSVLIFQKENRKLILFPLVSVFILMYGIMPIVRTELHVIPGGKQEMFSLPFQMTARYVKEHSDDVTDEEYEVIDRVLTMEDLASRYNPTNADPVKDYYQKGSGQDYVEYIRVWIKQGLRHPDSYIAAFNSMLAGWFSWSEYDPLMNMDWRNQHDTNMIPSWVPIRGKSEITANAYQEVYHGLYKIPFFQIFLTYGLYASLIPAFTIATSLAYIKRNKYYCLAVLPTIFSLGFGCWLAPVSTLFEGRRYLYPLVYTAPILIAWCMYIYKQNCRK
ncbi:hypothetical protein DW181_09535 [Clostridium sp. AM16-23]|nr:DUF6020 family protein [Clostridium sp. AM16-23]RHO37634.1 hypothetical protein DW181_09535 [Clostridium sp. AM16-23]